MALERELPLADAFPGEPFEAVLARFLAAAAGDAAAALARLEATLRWRRDFNTASLRAARTAEEVLGCPEAAVARHIAALPPLHIDGGSGGGGGGGMVIVWRLAGLRWRELLALAPPPRLLRYYVWLRERHLRALHAHGDSGGGGGGAPRQLRVVVDVRGAQLAALPPAALALLRDAAALDQAHYPGLLRALDFVGAPPAFELLWAALSAWVARPTAARVRVCAPRNCTWQTELVSLCGAAAAAALLPPVTEAEESAPQAPPPPPLLPRGQQPLAYVLLDWLWDRVRITGGAAVTIGCCKEEFMCALALRTCGDAHARSSPGRNAHADAAAPPAAAAAQLRGDCSGGGGCGDAVPLLHPEQLATLVAACERLPATPVRKRSDLIGGLSPIAEGGDRGGWRVPSLYGAELSVWESGGGGGGGGGLGGGRGGGSGGGDKQQIVASFTLSVHARGQRWVVRRRLLEFVTLRRRLLAMRLLREKEPWDRGGRLFDLPPTLSAQTLARGLEAFVRAAALSPAAAASVPLNAFLGNDTVSVRTAALSPDAAALVPLNIFLGKRYGCGQFCRVQRHSPVRAAAVSLAAAMAVGAFIGRGTGHHRTYALPSASRAGAGSDDGSPGGGSGGGHARNGSGGGSASGGSPAANSPAAAHRRSASASLAAAAAAAAAAAPGGSGGGGAAAAEGHYFVDDNEEEGGGAGGDAPALPSRPLPGVRPELRGMVSDAGTSAGFAVRGATYLSDNARAPPPPPLAAHRRKVPAGPAACALLHADLFEVDAAAERVDHVARHGRAAKRLAALQLDGEGAPFVFIVNFQVRMSHSVVVALVLVVNFQLSGHARPGHSGALCTDMCSVRPKGGNSKHVTIAALQLDGEGKPLVFVGNFQIPGSELRPPMSLVLYWGVRLEPPEEGPPGDAAHACFRRLLLQYVAMPLHETAGGAPGGLGRDCWACGRLPKADFRNARLKAVVAARGAPWVARRKLSSGRATLLSSLATLRHFRGAHYMEASGERLVMHAGVATCLSNANALELDVGLVLEGRGSMVASPTSDSVTSQALSSTKRVHLWHAYEVQVFDARFNSYLWPRNNSYA
ncbi:hypothetical protein JKP88DRAFT_244797 [Tribonema minus]|uniref:CRAL-TRIO domain-containing protein n=1 Tax=Tribonema minus TaxID=303371 RepID=A0A835Z3P2_9STRA|nr:hypothetical protein JKP88DRAFT_244797 [Tribonema minus]